MRHFLVGLAVCLSVVTFLLPAQAALTVLGLDDGASFEILDGPVVTIPTNRQLIEDSLANVIWYDFTRGSSKYADAQHFAATLEVDFGGSTMDDWRLPSASEFTSMANSSPESVFLSLLQTSYWLLDTGELFDFRTKTVVDAGPYNYNSMAVTQVPVPGAVWLLGAGLAGIIGFRKRRH